LGNLHFSARSLISAFAHDCILSDVLIFFLSPLWEFFAFPASIGKSLFWVVYSREDRLNGIVSNGKSLNGNASSRRSCSVGSSVGDHLLMVTAFNGKSRIVVSPMGDYLMVTASKGRSCFMVSPMEDHLMIIASNGRS